jgi:hypothetical protein
MVEGRRPWVERMKAEGKKFPGGRKAGTRWVTPAMRARAEEEQMSRRQVDIIAGLREERRRRVSEVLNAAFSTKAQRRAAIRAMPVKEARLAALRALDVLIERFNKTGSLYP